MDGNDETAVPPAAKPRAPRKTAARRVAKRKKLVRWSAKREDLFLRALTETANIMRSCRASCLSETSVRRHKKNDPEFDARWAAALREGYQNVETMLLDRTLNGVEKIVWHAGRKVGTVREYSDRLALALLAQHRATVTGVKPVAAAEAVPDEKPREELARRLSEMNKRMGGAG